MNAHEFPRLQK